MPKTGLAIVAITYTDCETALTAYFDSFLVINNNFYWRN